VVSAAAGATGSLAGQIAKIACARVVGIAGGPDKCRAVVEEFGFDSRIDCHAGELTAALKQHRPRRVDVYFDSVGVPILNTVLGRLAQGTRRALLRHLQLSDRRAHRTGQLREPASPECAHTGFNTLDQWGRFEEAFTAIRQWKDEGRLAHREHVFEGVEACVDALNGLFTGANIGKTLVKAAEPTPIRVGQPCGREVRAVYRKPRASKS
jgi:NADPH-dependent curcumin reductase CurA